MRIDWASIALLAGVGVACSSSGSTTMATTDGGDGGQDGAGMESGSEDAAQEGSVTAEAGAADSSEGGGQDAEGGALADSGDGAACGWTPYNDGLSGASVTDLRFDTRPTTEIAYATAGSNIFASSDHGQSWTLRGTYGSGSIDYLATPGTDASVLLATSSDGVIRSDDGGRTWASVAFGGTSIGTLGGIASAPSAPLRAYVGVSGAGIFRSDDGGNSWGAANNGYPYMSTLTISVATDDPDDVVTAGLLIGSSGGWTGTGVIVRSTNGGDSWQVVLQGSTLSGYPDIWAARRCAADNTILYAATASGVARSTDRGATWTVTAIPTDAGASEIATEVAINPTNCLDVYASTEFNGPIRSTDGAQTFGAQLNQGVDPIGIGIWLDRMEVDPQATSDVVLGGHSGVSYTTTSGTQWAAATGLLGLSVNSLATSTLNPSELWLASYGSGVWKRPSPTQPWQRVTTNVLPVDYAFVATPDPAVANRVWVGSWYTLYQSSNDGTSFTTDSLSQSEFAFGFDPSNTSIVYVATQDGGVFKSLDNGSTWTAMNTGLTAWQTSAGTFIDVRSIVVDPASAQTVYIGTNGAGVYKSTDGAGSWSNVLAPSDEIDCLLVVPGSPETLYACVKGAGLESSQDGGATWVTSVGLPSQDLEGIARDSASGDLFVTSGAGVYRKHGTQPWAGIDTNCLSAGTRTPAVVVNGTDRSLVVNAQGGVWAHPL